KARQPPLACSSPLRVLGALCGKSIQQPPAPCLRASVVNRMPPTAYGIPPTAHSPRPMPIKMLNGRRVPPNNFFNRQIEHRGNFLPLCRAGSPATQHDRLHALRVQTRALNELLERQLLSRAKVRDALRHRSSTTQLPPAFSAPRAAENPRAAPHRSPSS